MSLTYPNDAAAPEAATEEFVPVYARRGKAARGSQKKVRTWMILAPIAGVALIGGGALMLMNNGPTEATPLVEPAAPAVAPMTVAPVVPAADTMTTAAMAPVAATPVPAEPVAAIRRAEPARSAPARRAAPQPAATPRVETPAEPTGPRAYSVSPSTPVATPARMAAPAPAPAPVISVQPLS